MLALHILRVGLWGIDVSNEDKNTVHCIMWYVLIYCVADFSSTILYKNGKRFYMKSQF